jgi:hypothetical protein
MKRRLSELEALDRAYDQPVDAYGEYESAPLLSRFQFSVLEGRLWDPGGERAARFLAASPSAEDVALPRILAAFGASAAIPIPGHYFPGVTENREVDFRHNACVFFELLGAKAKGATSPMLVLFRRVVANGEMVVGRKRLENAIVAVSSTDASGLAGLTRDDRWGVRSEACRLLGQIPSVANQGAPYLELRLEDENDYVVLMALEALLRLGWASDESVARLERKLPSLSSSDWKDPIERGFQAMKGNLQKGR